MHFLIQQTDDFFDLHDFSIELIKQLKFLNWKTNSTDFKYTFSKDIIFDNEYIPVGSVEFVTDYIREFYNKKIKPVNIPIELIDYKYTNRNCFYLKNSKSFDLQKNYFVKSSFKIKHSSNGIYNNSKYLINNFSDIDYPLFVSEYKFDFESEYRCFIFNDKLVGIQNYLGDFKKFPNIDFIESCINIYSKYNKPAYTLDIGIYNDKTYIIEIHDFFSCGLYGFTSELIPYMLYRTFKYLVK